MERGRGEVFRPRLHDLTAILTRLFCVEGLSLHHDDCIPTVEVVLNAGSRGRMHRSRLSTLLIDVPADQAAPSAAFWSAALGAPAHSPPGEPQFHTLQGAVPDLVVAVQAVRDATRYHVDIETDDVAAEVQRLTELGAVEVSSWQGCHLSKFLAPALCHPAPQRPCHLRTPREDLVTDDKHGLLHARQQGMRRRAGDASGSRRTQHRMRRCDAAGARGKLPGYAARTHALRGPRLP